MKCSTVNISSGLALFAKKKQIFMAKIYHNLEISTCDPLNEMDNSILNILSTCMGKSISIMRINSFITFVILGTWCDKKYNKIIFCTIS